MSFPRLEARIFLPPTAVATLAGLGAFMGGALAGLGAFMGGALAGLGAFAGGALGGLGAFAGGALGGLGAFAGGALAGFALFFLALVLVLVLVLFLVLYLFLFFPKRFLTRVTLDRTPFATALPIALKNPPAVILVIFHIFIGVRNNPLELYQTHPFLPPPTHLFWLLEQQALFRAF